MYNTNSMGGITPEEIAEMIVETTFSNTNTTNGKICHSDEVVFAMLVPSILTEKQFNTGLKYMDQYYN